MNKKTMMTVLGLVIALFGPALVAGIGERFAEPSVGFTAHLLGLAALLAILASVLLIVFLREHQSLSSIGVKPFQWQSVLWGLGLAAFFVSVFSPVIYRVLESLNLGSFETGIARGASLPLWYLVIVILVSGITEEVLYRGYAVERIATLTGSYWIAGTVSVLAFGLAHVPMWGWGPALTTIVSGGVLTLFFIWRRDLGSNIIAHVVTDFVGIVFVPLLS